MQPSELVDAFGAEIEYQIERAANHSRMEAPPPHRRATPIRPRARAGRRFGLAAPHRGLPRSWCMGIDDLEHSAGARQAAFARGGDRRAPPTTSSLRGGASLEGDGGWLHTSENDGRGWSDRAARSHGYFV